MSETIRFDKSGELHLADVPGSGLSKKDPNAKSGNPLHDTRSGKFGTGSRAPKTEPPANVDPLAFARMMDAVRDAARNFDMFDEGDVQEFLQGRAKDPSVIDNLAFLEMVKNQRLDDIVDILDQQLRSSGSKPFGSRKVKITAPRGFLKRAIGGLDADQIAQAMHRLEGRGHDRDRVDDFFDKKRAGSPQAKGKRDAIQASDFDPVSLSRSLDLTALKERVENHNSAVELARTIVENIPQPVVNVTPQITVEAPKGEKVIERDEKGLIKRVKDAG